MDQEAGYEVIINEREKGHRSNVSGNCYCCGFSGHYKRNCDSRYEICDVCGIQGHLRAVCNQNPKVKKRNDSAFKGKRNDYDSLEGQNYVVETSKILRDFD